MQKVQNKIVGKKDFTENLAYKTGTEEALAKSIFESFLDLVVDELKTGNRLEFRNYFSLGSKIQKQRIARNIKSREEVIIPERRSVYFKPAAKLKNLNLEPQDWLNR
jgi:integration host factor subunit beta